MENYNYIVIFLNKNSGACTELYNVKNTPFRVVESWASKYVENLNKKHDSQFIHTIFDANILSVPENSIKIELEYNIVGP